MGVDVQLSGTFTIVNYAYKTRLRLQSDKNEDAPVTCMRAAADDPVADMEKVCPLFIRIYTSLNSAYFWM